jgi:hypothetical protein
MPNPPTFNTWTVIFLFAAIQGIIISLILYFNGKKSGRVPKNFPNCPHAFVLFSNPGICALVDGIPGSMASYDEQYGILRFLIWTFIIFLFQSGISE